MSVGLTHRDYLQECRLPFQTLRYQNLAQIDIMWHGSALGSTNLIQSAPWKAPSSVSNPHSHHTWVWSQEDVAFFFHLTWFYLRVVRTDPHHHSTPSELLALVSWREKDCRGASQTWHRLNEPHSCQRSLERETVQKMRTTRLKLRWRFTTFASAKDAVLVKCTTLCSKKKKCPSLAEVVERVRCSSQGVMTRMVTVRC